MKLTIKVDLGEGAETVTVSPFAVIGWEKEHRAKVSQLATNGIGLSDLAELSWRQMTLEGSTKLDLESFEKALVDLEPVDASDPT